MTTTQVQEYPNILKGIEGMLKNQTLEMSRISRLIETESKNMQKKLELKIKPLQKELETLKKDYESLQQEANKLKGE
jgi:cell division protein FtsB